MGMTVDIVTPFPEMFAGFLGESMVARAQKKGLIAIRVHDLRGFTTDKHRTVDDYPYGGGAGMILKPEPLFRAVDAIRGMDPTSDPHIFIRRPGKCLRPAGRSNSRGRRISCFCAAITAAWTSGSSRPW